VLAVAVGRVVQCKHTEDDDDHDLFYSFSVHVEGTWTLLNRVPEFAGGNKVEG